MTTRGKEKEDILAVIIEHGSDDGQVGQMCASVDYARKKVNFRDLYYTEYVLTRVVGDVDVARSHRITKLVDLPLDGIAHAAEEYRNVRCVGDQVTVGTEYSTGKVQPFLDVEGYTGLMQRSAHLLGNAHESMAEERELDRVNGGRIVVSGCLGGDFDDDVVGQHLGLASRCDDNGLGLVNDYSRAGDEMACGEVLKLEDVRLVGASMLEIDGALY
jgi:hypothetical protein